MKRIIEEDHFQEKDWTKITDIIDDKIFTKNLLKIVVKNWKNRDEKLIDGYSGSLIHLSQIDIALIPSSEVKNVKSENEDYDIGEELKIEYPSWMKNSLSGVKTNMKTKGVNCFFMAILYVISRKVYLTNKDMRNIQKSSTGKELTWETCKKRRN